MSVYRTIGPLVDSLNSDFVNMRFGFGSCVRDLAIILFVLKGGSVVVA